MSILSKNELNELNRYMMGEGAPIDIDNKGYNKIDYGHMSWLSSKNDLTDWEAYTIAVVLKGYSKTQLVKYADRIQETISYYQSKIQEVKVEGFTREQVKLSWNFNRSISDFIKNKMDKTTFRWSKPDGTWILNVRWDAVQPLMDEFVKVGYSVTNIQMVYDNLDELLGKQQEQTLSQDITLKVSRSNYTLDTLVVSAPYNKELVDVFHTIPYMTFDKDTKTWDMYIEYALTLYNELTSRQFKNLNMNELKPWADLVQSWAVNYDLIDYTKCPLKFSPYPFQIQDATKLLSRKVMLNANDMGAGKTFEQILVGESLPMKKLVICPPSLRLNWKKEILHVNHNANVHILYSADKFQTVDGWNIIGYSSLDKFQKQLEDEMFQVVMIDEAHYIQAVSNSGIPESKRAYAVLRIAATAGWVYPITGTPKTNRNKNVYNILKAIRHPLTRGKYAFNNFAQLYCDPQYNSFGWDYNGNSNDADLNEQLKAFMVRHLKKDVLPNLKKQRMMIPVEVDLREYRYEISEYLQNRSNHNAEDLARLMRARKILAQQKVGESIEFANNIIWEGKKVVIVTCFTDVVNAVEKAFKGNVVKLVGGMSDQAKDAAITEFQNGDAQVMVMNIIAGGVGVTLTKAYNMIINDFDWVVGNITQAEDRICRSGQTECCNIYYLYADGADMDEVFVQTLSDKSETINAAVDGGEGDQLRYFDMLDKALEKSTGVKKVRKMVKIEEVKEVKPVKSLTETQKKTNQGYTPEKFSKMTIEQLVQYTSEHGIFCKVYNNPKIYKMRLIMAIKAALK